MARKLTRMLQDINLDPTGTHEWMQTTIVEFALPEEKIIINCYGDQINIIDDIYYISRFHKGREKQQITVSDDVISAIKTISQARKIILKALT